MTARTGGVLTELRVRRGARVQKGDIIAVLSDEAREAQVAQANALVTQRRTELEAKRAADPERRAAEARAGQSRGPAQGGGSRAGRRRGRARPRRRARAVGGRRHRRCGRGRAAPRSRWPAARSRTIVALDPMLAVVEVAERKLAGIKVGDAAEVRLVTGERLTGKIRFVAKTASQTTRTYRVEVELPNADGTIPDGITAEVAVPLAPVPATRVPRSALTFSSAATSACAPSAPTTSSAFVRGQRGRGRADLHVGRRHRRRRARDRAGPGFRARRAEGRCR